MLFSSGQLIIQQFVSVSTVYVSSDFIFSNLNIASNSFDIFLAVVTLFSAVFYQRPQFSAIKRISAFCMSSDMKPPLIYSLSVSSAKSVSKRRFLHVLTKFSTCFSDVFFMFERRLYMFQRRLFFTYFSDLLYIFSYVLYVFYRCFLHGLATIFKHVLQTFYTYLSDVLNMFYRRFLHGLRTSDSNCQAKT